MHAPDPLVILPGIDIAATNDDQIEVFRVRELGLLSRVEKGQSRRR
jgi:hypothetical protein